MSQSDDRDGDDISAAEYVLGVLDGAERAAVARRIATDAQFARTVEAWEARLAPLAAGYVPVEPPGSVKQAVDAALFAPKASTHRTGFWQSLTVWRSVAGAALAALILAVVIPNLWPQEPLPQVIASLASDQSDVRYLVLYTPGEPRITLSHVAGERGAGHDFELWAIKTGASPVSLGVVPAGAHVAVSVDAARRGLLEGDVTLAISLEPAGGSPTGQPTGPVVAAGEARAI